ncbi:hypothetical protein D5125_16990 [Magnetovirga frankeli]|jgi:hypothetical protein|uniref:hypothetical protein n=1 Tax=Magnetovirga frankeli TaxID=947516 RepID=UPI001293962F|nr:hypothetical protein D5125_16990 [gamma proteobacterium SS-5]
MDAGGRTASGTAVEGANERFAIFTVSNPDKCQFLRLKLELAPGKPNNYSWRGVFFMHAIRETQTVENGQIQLQLPKEFWGRPVEIIVLPAGEEPRKQAPKSLRGNLKRYAQAGLIGEEEGTWQNAVKEKYESR